MLIEDDGYSSSDTLVCLALVGASVATVGPIVKVRPTAFFPE